MGLRTTSTGWVSSFPLSQIPGRVRTARTPLTSCLTFAHPPDGYHRSRVVRVGLELRDREKTFKDGRHVGLDFYDLLIEADFSTGQTGICKSRLLACATP